MKHVQKYTKRYNIKTLQNIETFLLLWINCSTKPTMKCTESVHFTITEFHFFRFIVINDGAGLLPAFGSCSQIELMIPV